MGNGGGISRREDKYQDSENWYGLSVAAGLSRSRGRIQAGQALSGRAGQPLADGVVVDVQILGHAVKFFSQACKQNYPSPNDWELFYLIVITEGMSLINFHPPQPLFSGRGDIRKININQVSLPSHVYS